MKLNLIRTRAFTYPNQCTPQSRYFSISKGGMIKVDVNGEIGNAVPVKVFNGEIRRLTIPAGYTRKDIIDFYKKHRVEFSTVTKGMNTVWNGNNWIGTLTDDADEALESLSHSLYCDQ